MIRPPAPITVRADHLSDLDARVLVGIAVHRMKTGSGPPWSVIGRAAGWRLALNRLTPARAARRRGLA